MTTQEKLNQELIRMALEDREKKLRFSTIMICSGGLFLMMVALAKLMLADPNQDTIPFHILFMFGSLVTTFGIFGTEKTL